MSMSIETLDIIWLGICIILVFIMQGGFLLLESGSVRSKNSINVASKNIFDTALATASFWLVGYGLMFGKTHLGLWGTSDFLFGFFVDNNWNASFLDSSGDIMSFLYQSMFCATAATIVSGAVAERMYYRSYKFIAIVISIFLYPIFGHWVWGESGWLSKMGFIDFAGSTVVHALGGWCSLAILVQLGARKDRFTKTKDGKSNAIAGSSLPVASFGCFILWMGWFGFNGGGITGGVLPYSSLPLILVNTHLAAVFGMIGAWLVSWFVWRVCPSHVFDHWEHWQAWFLSRQDVTSSALVARL